MSRDRERITIAGGGLAGLALGIGLRQRGVPVTLFEAGRYPRHRVCGEFISGAGLDALRGLVSWERLETVSCLARTAQFFVGHRASRLFHLPAPALCVPRFTLDALLAEEFAGAGGELRVGERWNGDSQGEGIALATGRRRMAVAGEWRWLGLKAHALGVDLRADLEMHFLPDGYVGLCRLPGDCVNACGLFRSRSGVPPLAIDWREALKGPEASALRHRMSGVDFVEDSFCSVAGLDYRPAPEARGECRVGDASGLIPPFTGNGMSLALESASLASESLATYSGGLVPWARTLDSIESNSAHAFRSRLRWARGLHTWLFRPFARELLVRWVGTTFFNQVFAHTRSFEPCAKP